MDNLIDKEVTSGVAVQLDSILPLKLSDVAYDIKGLRLIKDFSVTLASGSRTLILGPVGTSKSLLLRLCHGLLQHCSGEIKWQEPKGHQPGPYQTMVFQRPVMLRRSVRANLAFALKSQKVKKAERKRIIDDMLQMTGLTRLAKSPAVLFLDEPSANLDPAAPMRLKKSSTWSINREQKLLWSLRIWGRPNEWPTMSYFFIAAGFWNNRRPMISLLDPKMIWRRNFSTGNCCGVTARN